MKKMKLTENEIKECKELLELFLKDASVRNQKLIDLNWDPYVVNEEINKGIDEFYQLYQTEIDINTIEMKMEKELSDMTNMQKYSYLAKLVTAVAAIGGNVFDDKEFTSCLEDYEKVLKAIELEIIQQDDNQYVLDGIENMKKVISENIHMFAVLFVDNPDLAELQEACLAEDLSTVEAIALNSRKASVDMATAIFIMQEEGKLCSLGNVRYTPRNIGVMSAAMLEIDAAQKSGSLEMVKTVFEKACRAAVTLVVTSPGVAIAAGLFGMIALLTNFSTIWMLISGAAILINLDTYREIVDKKVSDAFHVGGRMLGVTLDKVKPLYLKLSDWVQNTVVPNSFLVWEESAEFVKKQIMIPTVAVVFKAKDFTQKAVNKIVDHVGVAYQKAKDFVSSLILSARNLNENEDKDIIETVDVEIQEMETFEVEEMEVSEVVEI